MLGQSMNGRCNLLNNLLVRRGGHSRLTTQAQRPGARDAWIATGARWPGSLQRMVRRHGVHNNHLLGALSVNSTTSAVIVTFGIENKIKYSEDLSSVWLAKATDLPVNGSPTD